MYPEPSPSRTFGGILLRVVSTVLGITLLTFSVMMRYSRETISAGHWQIFFRFGSREVQNWVVVPLPVLMVFVAVSLLGLLFIPPVRETVGKLLRDRRRRLWALGALAIWTLTMIPLDLASDPPYLTEQITYVALLFGSVGTLYLLLGIGRFLGFLEVWAEKGYQLLLRLPRKLLLVAAAGFVLITTNLISWLVFHHLPHIQDSVAQVFQARLFARGQLYAPSPPAPQFFDVPQIINNGRWYSQYPFGHALFLMLGVLVGAPWLINPLFGALTVVIIYYLGRQVYDEATARTGLVLASFSPFLLFMSSEYMNHSSALSFAALALLSYARAVSPPDAGVPRSRRLLWALLAGISAGIVVDIRPYTGMLVAAPLALDTGLRLVTDWRRNWSTALVMLAAGGVMVGLLLGYNYLTNGHPLLFGYVVKWGPGHEIGFGKSGWGEPYTLPRALVLNSIDLYTLNRHLFEFPIPSLLFIALFLAARPRSRWDWLLFATIVSLTIGYFFYWWHSILFGPRWYYEALPALVLLSARGIRMLPEYLNQDLQAPVARARIRGGVVRLIAVCFLLMLVAEMPARIRHYARYGMGVRPETIQTVRKSGIHNALVFTRKYEETFLHNSLPPGGDIVYVRDLKGHNPIATISYPGRKCYLVNRDTLYQLPAMSFDSSGVKVGLEEIIDLLSRHNLSAYRTVLWPAEELRPMIEPVAARHNIRVVSYRSLGQQARGDIKHIAPLLPAVAVWIVNDRSDGLAIFTYLDRPADQLLGPYRFRHLATSGNGTVTLFDLR